MRAPAARLVRRQFDCAHAAFSPLWAGSANALRKALTLAFPAVDFTLRYRTSQTFHPSWVEVSWHGAPSEADVHSVLAGALHEMSSRISEERRRKRNLLTNEDDLDEEGAR